MALSNIHFWILGLSSTQLDPPYTLRNIQFCLILFLLWYFDKMLTHRICRCDLEIIYYSLKFCVLILPILERGFPFIDNFLFGKDWLGIIVQHMVSSIKTFISGNILLQISMVNCILGENCFLLWRFALYVL